jgi:hypothetical protein
MVKDCWQFCNRVFHSGERNYLDGSLRDAPPMQLADSIETIMFGHYLGTQGPRGLKHYARNYMWAHHTSFNPYAMCILINKYGLPLVPRIEKGYSDWDKATQDDRDECRRKRKKLLKMAKAYVEDHARLDVRLFPQLT